MTERLLELGRTIRDARAQLGMTQEQLAERAGISRATLQNIERDGRGRDTTIAKLEKALGLPPGSAVKAAKGLQSLPGMHPAAQVGGRVSTDTIERALDKAMVAVSSMTGPEMREMKQRFLEELQAEGVAVF